ncbi:MAG: FtsX-like permease family protein [Truepera sp.]|nr:FtsX-like permease family protein [Truepera sp.]
MRPWWNKLWRDLRRHRGPFLAVAITTLLGVALFGASYGAYRNLVASYAHLFEATGFADLSVSGGDVEGFAAEARATPGVAAVATRTVADTFGEVNGRRFSVRVVGLPAAGQPDVDKVLVQEGTYLDPGTADGVLVEQHLAAYDGLAPGSTLKLRTLLGWREVPVLGVVASPEYVWPARSRQDMLTLPSDFGVVFASEQRLRLMTLGTGREALVLFEPGADRDSLLATLTATARGAGATAIVTQADQASNAVLHEDISGFGEMAVMFPLLFLGAAALTAFVVMSRLVHGQRRLIGTLLANGVRRRAVIGHHLAFGIIPALAGGVLGALAGEVLSHLLTASYTQALTIPVTIIGSHPLAALLGVVVALVAVTLGTLAPALDAARVAPAEAMRGSVPVGRGQRTWIERLVPRLRRMPPTALMALRDTLRNPGRSVTTGVGVVTALILVFIAWGMLDSVRGALTRQFEGVQREDAQVYVAGDAAPVRAELAGLPGVAKAEPVLATNVTVIASSDRYATALTAFESGTSMHGFLGRGARTLALPAHGALLGVSLRSELGLAVGDEVTLALPNLGRDLETTVAGFVDEPLGTFAYVSLEELARAQPAAPGVAQGSGTPAPDPPASWLEPNAVYLRYAAGADREALKIRIENLKGVLAVVDSHALQDAANGLMALFYAFVGAMSVFGCVLAFALIYSITSVTVAERSSELANLRASGVRQGQIARIVGGENLLLVLIALAPGLLLAYLTSAGFMASFESDMFRLPLVVLPRTWLLACVTVVLAAVLAALPALRSVARLDLAAAVRERAA